MADLKILITEDSPTQLAIIRNYVAVAGFDVVGVTCGEEVLEAVQREKPDMVILDVMLPGIDGFEVCRRLKKDPGTRNVPVIFLSAIKKEGSDEKALQAGAANYLWKQDFDLSELASICKSLVRTYPNNRI